MPEKFIGAEVRAGQFTNDKGEVVNFNNLMMSFVKDCNIGSMVNDKKPIVKVKNTREDIFRVFGEMITIQWLKDRLGWYADVFYDEKQKVAKILFHGPENPFNGSAEEPALDSSATGLEAPNTAADKGALTDDFADKAPFVSATNDEKKGGKK